MVSTCYQPASNDKPRTVYALSEEGDIEILNREDSSVEKIKDAGLLSTSKLYGYVNKIRLIDGAFYVCGHQCQVYRKTSMDWEHIDQGLTQVNTPPRKSQELSFEGFVKRYIDQTISLMDINGTTYEIYMHQEQTASSPTTMDIHERRLKNLQPLICTPSISTLTALHG